MRVWKKIRFGCALGLCCLFALANPARAQSFDFYVLALSWSPGFCALEGAEKGREQCASGRGARFVVHGLWPQREGTSAIDCPAGQRPIPRMALDQAGDVFPDDGLARYQWRKHGGCTGLAPSAWLDDVRRARTAVSIPAQFLTLQQDLRVEPEDILRAFREANPRLRAGMASVSCPRNIFQEIRICMSRDLREFVPCPQVVQQSCRARSISVRPPA
jgi:ribonuclease T2